jgi:hypothetical protein
MPGGRPRIVKDGEELELLFNAYIKKCEETAQYPNMSGFCWELGTSRDYIASLEADYPVEFSHTISKIREYFANFTINNGQRTEKNQALNIFLLKNYGYKDKQEIEHSGSVGIEQLFANIKEDRENGE